MNHSKFLKIFPRSKRDIGNELVCSKKGDKCSGRCVLTTKKPLLLELEIDCSNNAYGLSVVWVSMVTHLPHKGVRDLGVVSPLSEFIRRRRARIKFAERQEHQQRHLR